ncbi:Universal stress protein [Bordetella sputigena]|uniref:universal stress protein n=1 Tax=Bordetella sputigena TaxID=1416810 RepID=UPI0039EFC671
MYRKIMVAVDGSKIARAAVEHAARLAASERATLYAICVAEYPTAYYTSLVYDPSAVSDAVEADARKVLDDVTAAVAKTGVVVESHLIDGSEVDDTVAERLLQAARDINADLVVLGTHGRRGVRRVLLGSVAEAFIRISDRPVLLYPDKASRGALAAD